MISQCSLCEREIQAYEPVFREITGWEKLREQGGANTITLRKETGRVACYACVTARRQGVVPGQQSLID